mmetsp:Transcript_103370/g.189266  ORF Transcript_103370/g.189266 Transcript_103370/m.189266 type:complete len:122 (+) Transcript_103370:21-386(+)
MQFCQQQPLCCGPSYLWPKPTKTRAELALLWFCAHIYCTHMKSSCKFQKQRGNKSWPIEFVNPNRSTNRIKKYDTKMQKQLGNQSWSIEFVNLNRSTNKTRGCMMQNFKSNEATNRGLLNL